MSKLAHICFTLIIYKQFNCCRFRASAYTNVDRLCAVFLYNICCFHDFTETNAPIERHWITLIHYKNDVNTENCFQNDGRLPSGFFFKLQFWSHDLYSHVILHLVSEFRVDRPISRRDIAKTIFNMASVRHLEFEKFRFLSNSHPRNGNLHLYTKLDRNRINRDRDKEIKLLSEWRPSAILNLPKLPFWSRERYLHQILHLRSEICINRPIWRRDIAKNDFQYGIRPPS